MRLEKIYKVSNFGLKAEIHSSEREISAGRSSEGERSAGLSSEGVRPTGHSSKPVGSTVCVLRPSHNFAKRIPATEDRYVRTLVVYIPTQ